MMKMIILSMLLSTTMCVIASVVVMTSTDMAVVMLQLLIL